MPSVLSPDFVPLDHCFESVSGFLFWLHILPSCKEWPSIRATKGNTNIIGFLDLVDHAKRCVDWTLEYHGRMNRYSEYNVRLMFDDYLGPGKRSAFVGPDPDSVYSEIFDEYFKAQKHLREQMKEVDENLPKLLDEIYKCELGAGNTSINATLNGILHDISVSLSEFQHSEEEEAEQHDRIQAAKKLVIVRDKEQHLTVPIIVTKDSEQHIDSAIVGEKENDGLVIVEYEEQHIPAPIDNTEASEQHSNAIVEDENIDGLVIVDPITTDSDDDLEDIQCFENSLTESEDDCDESIMAIEHDDDNWMFG